MRDKLEQIKWDLMSCDTFDRETPHVVEDSGVGLQNGFLALWKKTLLGGGYFINDGKLTETFTGFYLNWKDSEYQPRVEIVGLGEELTKKMEMVYHLAQAGDFDLVKLGIAQQIEAYVNKGVLGIEPATRKFLSLLPQSK